MYEQPQQQAPALVAAPTVYRTNYNTTNSTVTNNTTINSTRTTVQAPRPASAPSMKQGLTCGQGRAYVCANSTARAACLQKPAQCPSVCTYDASQASYCH